MTDQPSHSQQQSGTFRPSQRSQVPPFQVMDILGRVAELRAEGRDVVSLCAGEPGGGAPEPVNQRAAEIHGAGRALNYTPILGVRELREAIAGHYQRWYGFSNDDDGADDPGSGVSADNVAVTTGSSGAFVAAFLAAFDVGDRVAVARPGYAAYRHILTTLGCQVVEVDAGADTDFQLTPEMLEQAEVEHGELAGVVVASPNNPTGTMLTPENLRALSQWCRERAVRLVSDEIYHGITYDTSAGVGRGTSAWEYGREAVVVSSFSKYWGMPGWRVGWMLMPADLAPAVSALSGSVSLCPPAAAQYAAIDAFTEASYAHCDTQVADFARTRALMLAHQDRLGWTDAAPADGAFYFYARVPQAMLDRYGSSNGYCKALLDDALVALTPGDDFDTARGTEYVRVSFAAGYDAVAEGIERIVGFQNS